VGNRRCRRRYGKTRGSQSQRRQMNKSSLLAQLAVAGIAAGMISVSTVSAGEAASSQAGAAADRKSTRLNSSHVKISYAVFCLKHLPTTEIYPLSLHDALPISVGNRRCRRRYGKTRGSQSQRRQMNKSSLLAQLAVAGIAAGMISVSTVSAGEAASSQAGAA